MSNKKAASPPRVTQPKIALFLTAYSIRIIFKYISRLAV